jgi:hypothetical protein
MGSFWAKSRSRDAGDRDTGAPRVSLSRSSGCTAVRPLRVASVFRGRPGPWWRCDRDGALIAPLSGQLFASRPCRLYGQPTPHRRPGEPRANRLLGLERLRADQSAGTKASPRQAPSIRMAGVDSGHRPAVGELGSSSRVVRHVVVPRDGAGADKPFSHGIRCSRSGWHRDSGAGPTTPLDRWSAVLPPSSSSDARTIVESACARGRRGRAARRSQRPAPVLAKLAALTPRPEINLVLYHGVLAPASAR